MDKPVDLKPEIPAADQSYSPAQKQEWPLRNLHDHRYAALWAQSVLEDLNKLIEFNLDSHDLNAPSSQGMD